VCFLFRATGPSFHWAALLFDGSYLLVPVLIFREGVLPRSWFVRLCFRFRAAVLVLHAVGLEINQIDIKSTMVLYSSTLLRVAFRASCSLWSSWIPTASAVRYYTVMQSYFDCCGSLLSCQQTWCCSCSVCAVETDPKSTRHSLFFLLIDCTIRCSCSDRTSLSMSTRGSLLLSLSYSLVWSSGQSIAVSNTLVLFSFSVVVVHYHRLWGFRVSTSRSIGLISIMLVGHLTLISYTN